MISKNGTVGKVARHGKAFTLVEDGTDIWYGAFSVSQLMGAEAGDQVAFRFQEKNNGGTVFNNIQKDVQIVSKGTGGQGILSQASTPQSPVAVFGSMSLNKDRSIARQNACNVAAQLLQSLDMNDVGYNTAVATLLEMAKEIEAFTTGDADKQAVLAQVGAAASAEED